jgi:hypothetical protein
MKEFLLIFRNSQQPEATRSAEQMQEVMQQWIDWLGSIAAQNKLIDKGNRLVTEGSVIKPGNIVTDGPYMEIKEMVGGYTMIRANSLEEATALAGGCPILQVGGSVEVRGIMVMEAMK